MLVVLSRADQTRLKTILVMAQKRNESCGSSISVLPRALQQDDDGDLNTSMSQPTAKPVAKPAATTIQMDVVVTN
jgi:hypothetical protein